MTNLARPFWRRFARSEPTLVQAPAVAARPTAPAPTEIDRRRHPRADPLFAYLPAATGRGRRRAPRARLAGRGRAARGRRPAGRPARHPGRADRGALPRATPVGPGVQRPTTASCSTTLAAQAAPAIRVAQLVREQAVEIQARERLEQEMRVATLIQQQFLPRELPELPDWQVAAYYGPARAVGGDFYDFIAAARRADRDRRRRRHRQGRPGGADHGPHPVGPPRRGAAAHVARRRCSQRANEILLPEMPARMFVTCLYMILEPATGRVVIRQRRPQPALRPNGRRGRRAAGDGMPLGLLPGWTTRSTRRASPPAERPPLQRRARRGPRPGRRHVRLPPAPRADGDRRSPAASCWTTCSRSSTGSSARAGTRRTTSPCVSAPADAAVRALDATGGRRDRRRRPATASCSRPRCRASRATSAWRWTASPTPSPASASRRPGSRGSRPPSARPR